MQGFKYKEIAEKYDVTLNTVKSWKQRHGWQRNKGAPDQKGVHTKRRLVLFCKRKKATLLFE